MTAVWVSDEELRQRLARSQPIAPAAQRIADDADPRARFRRLPRLLTGDVVWDLALLVIAQARADAQAGDRQARMWLAYVRGESDRVPPLPTIGNEAD